MYKRIASISVEVTRYKHEYSDTVTIILKSYSTQILKMRYTDYALGSGFERLFCFDSEYYSRTTRRHQRLAKAFLTKCKDFDLDELHETALSVFGTAKSLTKAWFNINTQI